MEAKPTVTTTIDKNGGQRWLAGRANQPRPRDSAWYRWHDTRRPCRPRRFGRDAVVRDRRLSAHRAGASWNGITFGSNAAPSGLEVSRQSEKFLIGQSRKFLLTAVRLKDGTNRDEPTGTGRAGLAETSQGRKHQPTGGRPEDGSERPMGEEVAQADDQARRRGGRAWATRAALQSQAAGRDSTTSGKAFEATGLARFRPNVRSL